MTISEGGHVRVDNGVPCLDFSYKLGERIATGGLQSEGETLPQPTSAFTAIRGP